MLRHKFYVFHVKGGQQFIGKVKAIAERIGFIVETTSQDRWNLERVIMFDDLNYHEPYFNEEEDDDSCV